MPLRLIVSLTDAPTLVPANLRRKQIVVGGRGRPDGIAVDRENDVAQMQRRRRIEQTRDAHAGLAFESEPLGERRREHLHFDGNPRLARFARRVVRRERADFDDRQHPLGAALELDERLHAILRAERRFRLALDVGHGFHGVALDRDDDVAGPQRRLGLIGRTIGLEADDERAIRRVARQLTPLAIGEVGGHQPPRGELRGHRDRRRSLDRRRRERELFAIAHDRQLRRLSDWQREQRLVDLRKLLRVLGVDGGGVDSGQQIAGLHAGRLGRRLAGDPRHERARARRVADPRLHFDPEPAAPDAAVLDQRIDDRPREVARNRAAQPEADFVDADELAREIHERAAGIARIDRGVVPDPPHDRADVLAVERIRRTERLRHDHLRVADDALGDRLRQRERAAHREHRLARAQLRRVAELRRRKRRAACRGCSLTTAMSDSGSVPTRSAGTSS